MMNKVKPELQEECESNDESLDDIHSLFGITIDGGVREIDLDYLDGEDFIRFSRHVAYSDHRVYISARDGGLEVSYTFVSALREAVDLTALSG